MRGDVCYFTFKPPDKRRPIVILTRSHAISYLNQITVAPITTNIRDNKTSVWLDEADGMPEPCAVNLDLIETVPKEKLEKPFTHLSEETMSEIFEAIIFAFGFEDK